jgi:DNA-binding CsgD family transcriptional regulator
MAAADDLAIRMGALLDAVLTADSVPKFVTALNQTLVADGLTLVRRQKSPNGETVECPLDEWAPANITVVEAEALTETVDTDGGIRVGGCSDGSEVIIRPLEAGGGLSCSAAAGLVVRALKLHRTLVGSQVRSQATSIVLDAVPLGIILVNAAGRVLQTNRSGQQILALADGLSADNDGALLAAAPKDSDRLREVISEVAGAAPGGSAQPVGVLKLDRPSMTGSWLVAVIPVHARRRADTVSEIAAIFVTETTTGDPTGIPPKSLERLFALTPAEAKLLVALVDGLGLDDIAARFEVSKNTLRNQLNQIFRKTGANKQSELVRMVLASPAAMLHRTRYRAPDEDPG